MEVQENIKMKLFQVSGQHPTLWVQNMDHVDCYQQNGELFGWLLYLYAEKALNVSWKDNQ